MVVNFADGSKEFLYPSRELKEGDAVWHDGVRFRELFCGRRRGARPRPGRLARCQLAPPRA
jgi:hypothetical protein